MLKSFQLEYLPVDLSKSVNLQTMVWIEIDDKIFRIFILKKNPQPALAKCLKSNYRYINCKVYNPLSTNITWQLAALHSLALYSRPGFLHLLYFAYIRKNSIYLSCVLLTSAGIVLQKDKMSSDANDLALICRIPGRQLQKFSRATDNGLIYGIA